MAIDTSDVASSRRTPTCATVIAGSLTVTETGLTDLALPRLVQVRGALEVKGSALLTHLAMPALQAIDGRFTLDDNAQLSALELPVLHRVDSLVIAGNAVLEDLSGLPGLTDVIHELQISGNSSLVSADLPVTDVGGDVIFTGNSRLAHIRYTAAGRGDIRIASNSSLETLDMGSRSDNVRGIVRILDNGQLAQISIAAFDLAGLRIQDNGRLSEVSVEAFEIGDLDVRGNPALSNLDFLVHDQIDGDLTVEDNAGLRAASSLEALRRVRGNVRIAGNPVLKAALGARLEQVDGSLAFDGNDQLDNLGLSRLVHAGSLSVVSSGALTVLALPALTEVASIEVRGNPELRHTGGTAVQSGPDTNGNGKLDDDKVSRTEYACGQQLLTRLVAEPEGANCTAGGVAFFAGRDRNADRVLDPGEIEVTEYDCGDTLSRDVDIRSADDVAALASIRVVTGDLSVAFVILDVVSLPRLEHIGGAQRPRRWIPSMSSAAPSWRT